MNRNFVVSVVVMFIVSMALGFAVHGLALGNEYAKLVPHLFRSQSDAHEHFGYMIVANLAIAIGLTWIYRQGRENRAFLAQGLRFGVAVALLTCIPTYLIYYVVQPMPSDVVAQQVVYDTLATIVMGIVVAWLNRDPAPPRI